MPKWCNPIVLDSIGLNGIKNGAIRMTVCSAQPSTYAGISAVRLAETTTAPADLVVGAGTGAGRRLTTALMPNASISATGNGNHIALHDNSSILYYVTTCPLQNLTAGGTVNIPPWQIEIAGPT